MAQEKVNKSKEAAPANLSGKRRDRGRPEVLPDDDQRVSTPCREQSGVSNLQRVAGNNAVTNSLHWAGDFMPRDWLGLSYEAQQGIKSPGEPLSEKARKRMESRFGYDFSSVRVHAGGTAVDSTRRLNARAFTFGNDIVFGAGEYEPNTMIGQGLLAHELAHVVQQSRGGSYPTGPAQKSNLEHDANQARIAFSSSENGFVQVLGASGSWVAADQRSSRVARRLRSGTAGGVRFEEGPRDVISIRLSNTSGDMPGILASIDAVMVNFGSANRTYVRALGFAEALQSRLAEEGHPAATGEGMRMSRQRWLIIRVRVVRSEGRRIEGLELLPRARISEAPEGLTIEEPEVEGATEGPLPEEETSSEATLPAAIPQGEAQVAEQAAPRGWRGLLNQIGAGLESVSNKVSARWVWKRIMGQMAEWEQDLDAIGEIEGRSINVSGTEAALIPIGIVFSFVHGVLGTADLLAQLNPGNQALQNWARLVRTLSGTYTLEQFEHELGEAGSEARGLLTLGLGQAFDHMREGIREANAFRTTQAVTEIVMAILVVIGVMTGVRSLYRRSSYARMQAAVEAEAVAGAEITARPTTPSGVATRPTEPAPGLGERPTEPAPGLAERPTEPAPERAVSRTPPSHSIAAEIMTVEEAQRWLRQPGTIEFGAGTAEFQGLWARNGGLSGASPIGHPPIGYLTAEGRAVINMEALRPHPTAPRPTGPGVALERPPVAGRPQEVRLPSERPTEPGQPPLREPGRGAPEVPSERLPSERPTEPGQPPLREPGRGASEVPSERLPSERSTEPGQPPLREPGRVGVRRPIRSLAEARRLMEQYASGERSGGYQLRGDHAFMRDEWHSMGQTGEPPPAFIQTNGSVVFDTSQLGWPSGKSLTRGAERLTERVRAAQEARIAAETPRVARRFESPVEARVEIDAAFDAGRRPRIVRSPERYEAQWRRAGGEGTPPVAFVDQAGQLWVDAQRLAGH